MTSTGKLIALIPARSGSKRVPGKNIRELAGHPLIAYTIQVAKDSGLFGEHIYVSSDSDEYLDIAERYGARGLLRPEYLADDDSRDFEWIVQAINKIREAGHDPIIDFILRPTSPFRTAVMLHRAFGRILDWRIGTSLKAVDTVKQHPHKMWNYNKGTGFLEPLIDGHRGWLYPTQHAPSVFVQNSSLDVIWTDTLLGGLHGDYIGEKPVPFFTEGYEGFSVDYDNDWILAEALIERGLATLPEIT